jgi:hypothetical protein
MKQKQKSSRRRTLQMVSVMVVPTHYLRLQRLARSQKRSVASVFREALARYLKEEETA